VISATVFRDWSSLKNLPVSALLIFDPLMTLHYSVGNLASAKIEIVALF